MTCILPVAQHLSNVPVCFMFAGKDQELPEMKDFWYEPKEGTKRLITCGTESGTFGCLHWMCFLGLIIFFVDWLYFCVGVVNSNETIFVSSLGRPDEDKIQPIMSQR